MSPTKRVDSADEFVSLLRDMCPEDYEFVEEKHYQPVADDATELECDDEDDAVLTAYLLDDERKKMRAEKERPLQKFGEKEGYWITVNGRRVFITPKGGKGAAAVDKAANASSLASPLSLFKIGGLAALGIGAGLISGLAIQRFLLARKASVLGVIPAKLGMQKFTPSMVPQVPKAIADAANVSASKIADDFGLSPSVIRSKVSLASLSYGQLNHTEWTELSRVAKKKVPYTYFEMPHKMYYGGVSKVPLHIHPSLKEKYTVTNNFDDKLKEAARVKTKWVGVAYMRPDLGVKKAEARYLLASDLQQQMTELSKLLDVSDIAKPVVVPKPPGVF